MTSLVPKLPAEIIHLIIDALVEQSSGEPGLRTDVLHTCSRVSWVFHLHSQRHHFSHIHFRFDHNASKRAKRLLHVLVPPHNHYLHPFISSVTFIVCPPAPREGRWPRHMRKITQVVTASIRAVRRKLKRDLDWIACAMIFLAALNSLQEMTLASGSSRETINWQEVTRSMPQLRKVLWLAMHPGLRHLTFRNLLNLPLLYVLARSEPSPRLRKLTIDNSNFHAFSSEPYKDLPPSFSSMLQDRLATVEELKWVCWGAAPLRSWPNQLLSFSPTYPSLTRIVIHLSPTDSPTQFLQLLLSASRTLQSLELHDVHAFGPGLNTLASDYLAHFTALRHVGYKAKSTNTEYLRTQLDLFSKILLSARTPLPSLSSISVEILEFCTPDVMSDDFSLLMFSEAPHPYAPVTRRWSALDDALCNRSFIGLKNVCFDVKLFVETTAFEHHFKSDNLRPFVPQVYEHPLADVQVTIARIGGVDAYDLWVFEADREYRSD